MRKQIITALLTISVSVAIIAGCGTKKPLQTNNSVSSEQGSSVIFAVTGHGMAPTT